MRVLACGIGAVSPAGWGVRPLMETLRRPQELPVTDLERPGWTSHLRVRLAPTPVPRPSFLHHARLRRSSGIAQFAVAAALEALGNPDLSGAWTGDRLGIIFCTMCGSVRYTRRFYAEALQDPATASPLVFPETVFNAPSSHLAALLGVSAINYTLVGDPGVFCQALATGARWLLQDRVDGCLVVAAEETDWSVADAWRLFSRRSILAEGAGAVYLRGDTARPALAQLDAVTSPCVYSAARTAGEAIRAVRAELPPPLPDETLYDSRGGLLQRDTAEDAAWEGWPGPRVSLKHRLGEGLTAAVAWQCVAAIEGIRRGDGPAATLSVAGCNEQAIGARWIKAEEPEVPGKPEAPRADNPLP